MNNTNTQSSVWKQQVRHHSTGAGFSLIEVTLAIGIIAFALLAVVALLPVGMSANQSARDQAQAVQIVNAIGISIQSAVVTGTTKPGTYTYAALPPFGPGLPTSPAKVPASILLPTWTVPGSAGKPVEQTIAIGENGTPVDSSKNSNYRFLAAVSITPPKDKSSLGKACIMVAWPGLPLAVQKWITVPGSGGEPAGSIPQFTKAGPPAVLEKRQGYVEHVLYFHAN